VATRYDPHEHASRRLALERGTIFEEGPEAVALLYPSPYSTAMSSLGYQTIYRLTHGRPGRVAHRAFLPDDLDAYRVARAPLFTYEAKRPIGDYPVIAISVAYELEIAGVIQALELGGVPALAEARSERHPFVLAGGPLTFSNPLPLAPYVDAILMGEAEDSLHPTLDRIFSAGSRREALELLAREVPGAFVPSIHGMAMPPVEKAKDDSLPAYSQIVTPDTELRDMFLVEPERGCHRGCAYCVMRRSTNDGMRKFEMERVLSLIPKDATRVGLVGAATTDHPQIAQIVEAIVDRGCEVGLSSLRADRLNDRFMAALRRGGQTVLTTASDGSSQRLRDFIQRKNGEDVLFRAAELTRRHGFKRMKLYMMVGIPTETDDDIDELVDFSHRISKIVPVSLGIAPFVAKRNTPLDGTPFAGIREVEKRLERLRKGVRGKVELRATSARWAWVEYVIAQGAEAEGRAMLEAVKNGGSYRAYKEAFDALPGDRARRPVVRPGDRLGRAGALPIVTA
jgi:radical SAM superfamily enzyme YgiQ (UPF0313 family)